MALKSKEITITTDGSGDAVVYSGVVAGRIVAIKYSPGTIDTGADLTIVGDESDVPILVVTDAGTNVVWFYPVVASNLNTDASALATAYQWMHVFKEKIKCTVAQGGASKTGAITFFTDE